MKTVERLVARARLDDPTRALRDAHAEVESGFEDWEQWLDEYDRGEALILRFEVWAELGGEARDPVHVHNRGVWVESTPHPPKLEQQVAELVSKDYALISDELRRRGCVLDVHDLAEMHVHVELSDELRDALRARPPGAGTAPAATAALSRTDDAG